MNTAVAESANTHHHEAHKRKSEHDLKIFFQEHRVEDLIKFAPKNDHLTKENFDLFHMVTMIPT